MAERSTAAVGVAAGDGEGPPVPGEPDEAAAGTADRTPEQDAPDEAADGADEASGAGAAPGDSPETPAGETTEATAEGASAEKPADEPGDGDGDGDHDEGASTATSGADPAPSPDTKPRDDAEPEPVSTPGRKTPGASGKQSAGASGEQSAKPRKPSAPASEAPARNAGKATAKTTGKTPERAPAEPTAAAAAAAAAKKSAAPAEAPAKSSSASDLHSGYKLAGRYRLEECVTRLDGFSSWRAVDEKLRRAVGVHLLPADHPRARSVLAAARSSALLGDPRFVQVLDAVEENDLVYVVQEWLPDATELTALLASGPLEVHDAYQMVSQVTQAMTAAHREGLAHLRLTPGAVLRTSSGQWRVRGLAVNAALRGITSATPQRTDTEAIGALLYASLTQRWPYERDAYGLSGLPKGVGLIAPDQVRAGVHRRLSELAMRALVNDGATASRQEPACTTPEELLAAINAQPKIRPPEPAFTAPPEYRRTTYQQGVYSRAPGAPGASRVVGPPAPPPPLQGRTGRALKWGVAALLVVALGLGSWQLADALLDRGNSSGKPGPTETTGGSGQKAAPAKSLKIAAASEFAPDGDGIKENEVPLAVDGKNDTAWVTPQYFGYPNFGNYGNRKQGSGIIVDLGRVQEVSGLDIDLYRSGQKLEVRAADPGASAPSALGDFPQRLTKMSEVGGTVQQSLPKPVRTRYVLVHITSLPPDGSQDRYRGGISEIKVLGRPVE